MPWVSNEYPGYFTVKLTLIYMYKMVNNWLRIGTNTSTSMICISDNTINRLHELDCKKTMYPHTYNKVYYIIPGLIHF